MGLVSKYICKYNTCAVNTYKKIMFLPYFFLQDNIYLSIKKI